ncbi:MAG: SBBP repeat-containing protein, partial [Nitrospira sp.]|nr:SBBP repeat-containing protein [Nitrospira sp.]
MKSSIKQLMYLFSLIAGLMSLMGWIWVETPAEPLAPDNSQEVSSLHLLLTENLAKSEVRGQTFQSADRAEPDGAIQARTMRNYGQLPLHFEVNQGQTDAQVKFLSRGRGYSLFLTSTEAVLVLRKPQTEDKSEATKVGKFRALPSLEPPSMDVLRMKLVGANPESQITGQDELPGKVNYFVGSDPAKWRTDIPTFAKVRYQNVYPGVDLVYYGNQHQVEYDWVIAPGVDPGIIQFTFDGADNLEIDAQGDLILHLTDGEVHLRKPHIYQEINGVQQAISGGYVILGSEMIGNGQRTTDPSTKLRAGNGQRTTVGFQVAAYDTNKPLIIDPVLVYSTYLGGANTDEAFGVAVDTQNRAYIVGYTNSTSFPSATSLRAFGGSIDAFVARLNAAGTAYTYFTFLGGTNNDFGTSITVDATNNAYITGYTNSTNYPTTAGAFDTTFNGGPADAFVTKLNATGGLTYSTFLGGVLDDRGFGIDVDASNNAHVTGHTSSEETSFPLLNAVKSVFDTLIRSCRNTVPDPMIPANRRPGTVPFDGVINAFVTKLNTAGSALVYSTYLGGSLAGDFVIDGNLGDDDFLDPGPGP